MIKRKSATGLTLGEWGRNFFVKSWADPSGAMGVRGERIFFCLTLLAIGLGVAVRLIGLDYSLWHDEIASIAFAQQPMSRLWSDWMVREPNPPLYYTILHYWMGVFGQSDLAIKSLSAFFGSGTVLVAALISRRIGGSWLPAMVTALFVGLNPYHIFYSQHARAYALAGFATSVACLALVRIVKDHHAGSTQGGARSDWAVFTVGMLAALYSHTTILVLYAALNIVIAGWILASDHKHPVFTRWMVSNLIVGIGYAWWALITFQQMGSNKNLDWMDEVYAGLAVYFIREVFAPQPTFVPTGIAAVSLVPVVIFALMMRWGAAIMALCAAALLIFYLGSQQTTIMQERTILGLYPIFAVGLGLAIHQIRQAFVAGALVLLPLTLSGFAYREDYPNREWDRWPEAVALASADPTIPVFVINEAFAMAFGRYCQQRFGSCPIRVFVVTTPENSPWSKGLSGQMVISQHKAWSVGGPVMRTVEWDEVPTLFPQRHVCSATDGSSAYQPGESKVLGQLKMVTWYRRAECSDKR